MEVPQSKMASCISPISELWFQLGIFLSMNRVQIDSEDYRYQLLILHPHHEFVHMQNNRNMIDLCI